MLPVTAGALLMAACGVLPTVAQLPPSKVALAVQPGKSAEECVLLAARERIEYRFTATTLLDFNLHTHRGREVHMPVKVDGVREQSGTFAAPQGEEYCMTWSNRGAVPSHIDGEWRRLP